MSARPTTGNTVAHHRFDLDRPTMYRAMYDDGTYGPERTTRELAEADYTNAEQMPTACPWLPHDTASLDPDTAYHACRNYYGF